MHNSRALKDFHQHAHRSLEQLLVHCGQLGEADLRRKVEGFGFPTIVDQLEHMIGAERYWISVLQGTTLVDEWGGKLSLADLEKLRENVIATTESYLESASDGELNTSRLMTTWGWTERSLVPAHVFMRTLTHLYHHQGQVVAMCRILGKPCTGVDYPIV